MATLSDEVFAGIVAEAPSAIVVVDNHGTIVLANRQAEQLFGWTSEELVSQPIEMLVPPRSRPQHTALRSAFSEAPERRAMGPGRELTAVRKDGSEVAVEIGLAPLETAHGRFMVSTIMDLTDRRQAEAHFRVVVEASPSGIAMVDERGVIILTNPALEELFGYGRGELVGRPIEALVPERLRGRHPENRASFTRDPRPRAMGSGRDLRGQRKDGTEVAVEIGLAPITTEDGTFVLATVVDITERQKAAERFRSAVESAPNAMIMVDADGVLVLANSRAEEIFGYQPATLIGEPIARLIPKRFRRVHPGYRERFAAEPSSRAMGAGRDLFGLRCDGTEFPVEIGLNPIHTADGQFVLASVIDISERKRSEEVRELDALSLQRTDDELRAARRRLDHAVAELERRNGELDELGYAVAHDLKSPLRGIHHLAQWLIEDGAEQLNETTRGWLHQMQGRVDDMDRMLEGLLDYTRTVRSSTAREQIQLGTLVAQTAALVASTDAFEVRHAGPDVGFQAERRLFARVLELLLDNAIKHHDKAEGIVTVRATPVDDERLSIEVADDGPGIPPEQRARVFELFRRLKTSAPGSGVGLTLVKRLVEGHGGEVEITGDAAEGTVVRFSWPATSIRWDGQ